MTYHQAFYDAIAEGCRTSAQAVVPVLMELFKPLTVVDVGCGEGHWLAEFAAAGCKVTGVDGAHVQPDRLAIDPEDFRVEDLSCGPPLGRYDLCLSLEVAEHLPERSAADFVFSLVMAAPVVVFSAAIPGQGGAGHVNEQWPAYWVALFAAAGFVGTGALRWRFWDDSRVENWYRQNLIVFARQEGLPDLSRDAQALWEGRTARAVHPVVHPVLWDARRPQ